MIRFATAIRENRMNFRVRHGMFPARGKRPRAGSVAVLPAIGYLFWLSIRPLPLQETLFLSPESVERFDGAFDSRHSNKLAHWLR